MTSETHFEVHAYKASKWSVISVADDQDTAKQEAKQAYGSGKYAAVKVLRERYDATEAVFNSISIATFGQMPIVKKMQAQVDPLDKVTLCWNPTDLYSYEGRRAIRMLLGSTLDSWGITPTELLHDPAHYIKLDNSGTLLQNAIQRTAIKQIQDTGSSVQERMRELYDMTSRAYSDMKAMLANTQLPALETTPLDEVISALEGSNQRITLFSAVLSAAMGKQPNTWAKFTYCLTLLKSGLPSWVVGVLDYAFCELVQTPAVLRTIMQSLAKESELEKVVELVNLRHGKSAVEGFEVFNTFITQDNLPHSRTAFEQLLLRQMRGSTSLTSGDLGDQLGAIETIRQVCADDLTAETAFAKEITAAIDGRCDRALTSHSLNLYMSQTKGPLERTERLLLLEPKVHGVAALKRLAEQIIPIIEPQEQRAVILRDYKNPIEAMSHLRRLQVLVEKSRFPDRKKEILHETLDMVCSSFLSKSGLMKKIEASDTSPAQKAIRLLTLLASATFTEGKCGPTIRADTRQRMRKTNVLDELLKTATSPQEQMLKLKEFMDLLTAAGLAGSSKK